MKSNTRSTRLKELWSDPLYRAKQQKSRHNSTAIKSAAKQAAPLRHKKHPEILIKARKALALKQKTNQQKIQNELQTIIKTSTKKECVFWRQSKKRYPMVYIPAKRYVHRLICEIAHGPPPNEKDQALHSCGNGHIGCINPHHLRWDSAQKNAQEYWQQRRQQLCSDPTLQIIKS